MTFRSVWLIVPLAALPSFGCGTAANTVWLFPEEGGQRVYGGVRADLDCIKRAAAGKSELRRDGDEFEEFKRQCRMRLWPAVDLPFSFVGDTITLPYTLAAACRHRGRYVYDPTDYPQTPDAPRADAATGEAAPGSALSKLVGNRFSSWTMSPRLVVPPPDDG